MRHAKFKACNRIDLGETLGYGGEDLELIWH